MNMIRAIFFDFDGVLTLNERGSTVTIGVIQKANPDVSASTIQDCYYKFHHQMLRGEVTHFQVWNNYCKCIGKDISPDILYEAFSETPINEDMMQLASELSTAYRLGILTDNAADRMEFLIQKHGLGTLFDPIVISAKVGVLKNDAELFEHVLKSCGHEPEECIFIDNQERNLVVPARLGFKTYLFSPRQNDISGLKRRLAEWSVTI